METIETELGAIKTTPNQAADKLDEIADKVLKIAFLSFLFIIDLY